MWRHLLVPVLTVVAYGLLSCTLSGPTQEQGGITFGTPVRAKPPLSTLFIENEPQVCYWVVEEDGRRVRYYFRQSEIRRKHDRSDNMAGDG